MLTEWRQPIDGLDDYAAKEPMTASENQGLSPFAVPEAADFLAGAAAGVLRLPRCSACDRAFFPPRPFCPECGNRDVEQITASGRATLYSYVISHMPTPGFEPPFAIAVVALEEGPRMMTNIVDSPQTPEALVLDMALEVTFEPRGGVSMPCFRPASGG